MIRFYESIRHNVRDLAPSMSDERYYVLDTPSLRAMLEIKGIPKGEWEEYAEAAELMFATEHGRIDRDQFPLEDADGF